MNKLNTKNVTEIWDMRHLSVKEFLAELSNHPNLKFLITAVGFWWLMGAVFAITIGVNVIYYIFHIFQLVLR